MPPCRRQVGASLRRPQRSERYIASYSESNFCAKSHTGGFWGAGFPLPVAVQQRAVRVQRRSPDFPDIYKDNLASSRDSLNGTCRITTTLVSAPRTLASASPPPPPPRSLAAPASQAAAHSSGGSPQTTPCAAKSPCSAEHWPRSVRTRRRRRLDRRGLRLHLQRWRLHHLDRQHLGRRRLDRRPSRRAHPSARNGSRRGCHDQPPPPPPPPPPLRAPPRQPPPPSPPAWRHKRRLLRPRLLLRLLRHSFL